MEKYWKSDKEYKAVSKEDTTLNENISSYLKEVLMELEWEQDIFRYL